MRIALGEQVYHLGFSYHEKRKRRTIICQIRQDSPEGFEKGQLLAEGTAQCHEEDAFSRVAGRKVALERALFPRDKPVPFDRRRRREIWLQFLARHRFTEGRGPLTEEEEDALRESEWRG